MIKTVMAKISKTYILSYILLSLIIAGCGTYSAIRIINKNGQAPQSSTNKKTDEGGSLYDKYTAFCENNNHESKPYDYHTYTDYAEEEVEENIKNAYSCGDNKYYTVTYVKLTKSYTETEFGDIDKKEDGSETKVYKKGGNPSIISMRNEYIGATDYSPSVTYIAQSDEIAVIEAEDVYFEEKILNELGYLDKITKEVPTCYKEKRECMPSVMMNDKDSDEAQSSDDSDSYTSDESSSSSSYNLDDINLNELFESADE